MRPTMTPTVYYWIVIRLIILCPSIHPGACSTFPHLALCPGRLTTSDSTISFGFQSGLASGEPSGGGGDGKGKGSQDAYSSAPPTLSQPQGTSGQAAPATKGHSFSERWPSAPNSFWEGELLPGPSLLLARCQQFPYPLLTPKLSFIQSFSSCPILSTPSVSLWD